MLSFKSSSLVALFLSTSLNIAGAANTPAPTPYLGQALSLRGLLVSAEDSGSVPLQNFQDKIYIADIVLGGQSFTVAIDTGSSDLWVLPPTSQSPNLAQSTEISYTQTYDIGQAKGTIEFADFEFAGYGLSAQAFLLVHSTQDLFIINNHVCDGMLGLSFLSTSGLNYLLSTYPNQSSTAGANAIYNILEQNPSVSTFFDIQLHRATDLGDTSDGSLTIGTHMSGFEGIDKAPHLPLAVSGRWAVVLDRMSVNGKAFSFNESVVSSVPSKKIAVTIDSGFTFPPIPPAAADYIYSSIPGAVYNSQSDNWIVPCNETTDLTFTFGGVDFPMHYLDITYVYFSEVLVNKQYMNVTYCSNTFTRNKAASIDTVDANLGDPFMRNAYASFNFNGLTTDGGKSYMQMIPTTDFDTALPEFQASRAKTLASLPPELPPADFLAALHGQSVSPSDLITTPTFNAPPATATAGSKDVAANEALRGAYMSLFIPLSAPVVVCLSLVLV